MLKAGLYLPLFLFLLAAAEAQYCRYERWSSVHTFCLPKNFSCNVLDRGVTPEEKAHILQLHNDYRSKIAMGQESQGGGMPQASNMLQLVWDDELAEVAQSLSDSCKYGHDCHPCRMVHRFLLGQNIGRIPGGRNLVRPEWDKMIGMFYDEVANFNKRDVSSYVDSPKDKRRQWGHFSAMIWAKTWKIGCGWTLYEEFGIRKGYYACNFGPAGNIFGDPVYKTGRPCSACPSNTCCGQYCGYPTYPGLCKVVNENLPPEGDSPHFGNELFYCNFNNEPGCSHTVEGPNVWSVTKSNGGSWMEAVLNGGQNSTLHFQTPFRTRSGRTCFTFISRRGPNVANTTYSNQLNIAFQMGQRAKKFGIRVPQVERRHMFITSQYPQSFPRDTDIYMSVNFYVPPYKPAQFVQLNTISITEGACPQ